ncbi:MAG: hypothetical protein NT062_30665 [Proteobacteria bacterium]|nr:hypothetical protein [Pseudomonadota bacterium]
MSGTTPLEVPLSERTVLTTQTDDSPPTQGIERRHLLVFFGAGAR